MAIIRVLLALSHTLVVVSVRAGVKVAGVVFAVQLGHKLRLLPEQRVPVNLIKEGMRLHLRRSAGAQSVKGRVLQQARDDVLRLVRQRPVLLVRPLDAVVDHVGKELLGRLAKEGHAANEKLVENDAQRPPVDRLRIALLQNHLRRQVLGRAEDLLVGELLRLAVVVALAEGRRQVHQAHLGEAKIGQLDMSEGGDEQVVRLQVAVDDAKGVQVLHRQDGLRKVQPGQVEGKGADVLEEGGTVAALDVLHDHAEVLLRLEAAQHAHHKGIVGEAHDVPLGKDLLHLVAHHQVVLVDLLHSEALPRLNVPHQVHRPVGAIADQLDHLVVVLGGQLRGNFQLPTFASLVRLVQVGQRCSVSGGTGRRRRRRLLPLKLLLVHDDGRRNVRQRVLIEAQLADDVLRNGDDVLAHLRFALCRLQEPVELLRVKLQTFEETCRARNNNEDFADQGA